MKSKLILAVAEESVKLWKDNPSLTYREVIEKAKEVILCKKSK